MLKQIFSIDKKFWTTNQSDQVSQFIQYNSFFSKYYQKQILPKFIEMFFYRKIFKQTSIVLQNNKKPQFLILLSGKVNIFKKVLKQKIIKFKNKKADNKQTKQKEILVEYQFFESVTQQNQTVNVGFQCKVSVAQGSESEIIYVPSNSFQSLLVFLENKKIELILKQLHKLFPKVKNKSLMALANSGACFLKEFKINDYIYKIGSQPVEVYYLLEGAIKLQKSKQSANKTQLQAFSVGCPPIFGLKDINLPQRSLSAIVGSAYAKVLAINKNQFIRFAKQNLKDLKYESQIQERQFILPLLKLHRNSSYFIEQEQKMARFSSKSQISDGQKKIEDKLMRNCHGLVNLSPKKSRSSRLDSKNGKDYTKDQFEEKFKLFSKIRPNAKKIDFDNPIISLSSSRGYLNLRKSLENFNQ